MVTKQMEDQVKAILVLMQDQKANQSNFESQKTYLDSHSFVTIDDVATLDQVKLYQDKASQLQGEIDAKTKAFAESLPPSLLYAMIHLSKDLLLWERGNSYLVLRYENGAPKLVTVKTVQS